MSTTEEQYVAKMKITNQRSFKTLSPSNISLLQQQSYGQLNMDEMVLYVRYFPTRHLQDIYY